MEINEFITNFKEQFDDPEAVELNADSNFRDNGEWNSLTGLMTIAMADEIYGVTLTPNELRSAETVQDLYEMIKSKK
ncbi:MAG: acyl carrier protein [Muribaculaceae bacterium]|nr:acyl carrier protein [Muribaculaceae bacterium]